MKRILMTIASALFAVCAVAVSNDSVRLASPDGYLVVTVNVDKEITYTLEHDSDLILDKSVVSISMTDGTVFDGSQPLKDVVRRSVDQTITTVLYKKDEVKDSYNEMTLCFEDFSLVFRAYDDGMAYRFISHLESPVNIRNEVVDFKFAQDWNLKRLAFLPLMVDGPSGKKAVSADGKKFEILDVVKHRPVAGPVDPGDYILFEFPVRCLSQVMRELYDALP